jgi:hypothetical protein
MQDVMASVQFKFVQTSFLSYSFFSFPFIHLFRVLQMSSPSLSGPQELSASLTTAEELTQIMRQVSLVDNNEDDDPFSGGGHQVSSSPNSDTTSVNVTPSSGPLRSNKQRAARQLADRLGLFPYQKEALKKLVKVDMSLFPMFFI